MRQAQSLYIILKQNRPFVNRSGRICPDFWQSAASSSHTAARSFPDYSVFCASFSAFFL